MLNKVIIAGRLTKAPEFTATASGLSVARFTVAVDRKYQKDGERTADFINVVCFKNTADFVSKYFDKGQAIIVVGSIQTRSWEQDGEKRYATEVVADEVNFCGSKTDGKRSQEDKADPLDELKGFAEVKDDDGLPWQEA